MEFAHTDGKLRVHYSDRLVTLLREVCQLSAFGFSIPAKIQQTVATADKFNKHGVILKQVWFICVTKLYIHICTYKMNVFCIHVRTIYSINSQLSVSSMETFSWNCTKLYI